jgi:hypothetical protein
VRLRPGQTIPILAALLLLLGALTVVDRAGGAAPPPAGLLSSEPAGAWVTSNWPTTRYYTTRAQVAVWARWAADNRVWFETEGGLLRAYPGRERK